MSKYDWYRLGVDIVTMAIIPAGIFVAKFLSKIKNNDLHHIAESQTRIEAKVDRIDDKLDKHLEWHLDHKGN